MNMHHKAPNFKNPSALIAACVIRGGSFHGQFPAEKDRRVLLASHELGLNGAPIVLLYLARSLRRLGWQPVLIAPVAGPLLDTLVRESFPVLICPKVTENNVLLRSAGLFRFVVLNTLVFAKAAAALNGSDTRVLWWVHEAEDTAAMRERARSFYLSNFSIASFDRRLEAEILPELLGGKPQTQPLQPAETPKQITKPLGSVLEVISWAIQPHAEKGLLRKGLYSLRTNGPRVTWQKAMQKIYFSENYRQVTKQALFTEEELARQRKHHFTKEVKFSIVVPLYNTTERFLRDMIESVQAQTYAGWELCMADGSDAQHGDVQRICREYVRRDKRIRYRKLEKNLGISGNTNACLEMATGDYIGLFDHDDLLHPAALYEVMCAIESTGADFIYTDECTFHDTPKDAYMPHFKPDFAPDNLRTNNYICHFTVFKRSLLDEVGLFDPTCDGSQDHDMVLRLTEKARRVAHIPEILYYWRAHAGSVAESPREKPYVIDAGIRAVEKQLDRLGLDGKVEPVRPGMTFYRTRYTIKGTPKVSILIPNYEYIDDLRTCLNSIFHKTTWPNYEIVIVENNSTSRELFAYYESIQREHANVFVVTWEGKFNYSAINNFGAQFCTGEYLLLLNNNIEVITPDWIEEMLMFAQREDVGAVGAMLYYPDNTIQNAGICLGMSGTAGSFFQDVSRNSIGYMGRLIYTQNVSAVSSTCMLLRREVWDKLGGLDEDWAVAFNDVDLCMRIRKAGYLTVWTPYAELIHYESKSRGQDDTPQNRKRFEDEVLRFQSRWAKELEAGDPYYNPNFSLVRSDFFVKPNV